MKLMTSQSRLVISMREEKEASLIKLLGVAISRAFLSIDSVL